MGSIDAMSREQRLEAEAASVRPLIDAIADWETSRGTAALLLPDEYEDFCKIVMDAMSKSSPRASRSYRP